MSPLVLNEKPKGAFRICLDMRPANQAIVREENAAPTDKATIQEVFFAESFSKPDFNMAFYLFKRLAGVNMTKEKRKYARRLWWQIIQNKEHN